jgi:hypothetical protein
MCGFRSWIATLTAAICDAGRDSHALGQAKHVPEWIPASYLSTLLCLGFGGRSALGRHAPTYRSATSAHQREALCVNSLGGGPWLVVGPCIAVTELVLGSV